MLTKTIQKRLACKLVVSSGRCQILAHGKKSLSDSKQLEQATANEQPLHGMSSHATKSTNTQPNSIQQAII